MNEGYANNNDANDHHEGHGENIVAPDEHPDYADVPNAESARSSVEHFNQEEEHGH